MHILQLLQLQKYGKKQNLSSTRKKNQTLKCYEKAKMK